MNTLFAGTMGLILFIFFVVLAILWFLLPFAVFGIKSRMDTALSHAATASRRLEAIESILSKAPAAEKSSSTNSINGVLPNSPASLNTN